MRRLLVAAMLVSGASARAQSTTTYQPIYNPPPNPPLTLDPSGSNPVTPGAPPNPYAPPGSGQSLGTQPYGVPTAPGVPGGPQAVPSSPPVYLGGGDVGIGRETGSHYEGEVPEVHVVQKGDTLWDICAYYFSNPWRWPEVW